MKFKIVAETIYDCTLENAFKTPMLCDLSKIHTGYMFMPKVTHTTHDENWGKPGSSKKVYVDKSLTQNGGYASMDRVLEREENKYWKIQVDDFQSWVLGFHKFIGEWKVTEIENNKVLVKYTYWLHSDIPILYPLNWIFVHFFWKSYMNKVLENVRQMTINNEPYLYD